MCVNYIVRYSTVLCRLRFKYAHDADQKDAISRLKFKSLNADVHFGTVGVAISRRNGDANYLEEEAVIDRQNFSALLSGNESTAKFDEERERTMFFNPRLGYFAAAVTRVVEISANSEEVSRAINVLTVN